jgi:hypothetical protein
LALPSSSLRQCVDPCGHPSIANAARIPPPTALGSSRLAFRSTASFEGPKTGGLHRHQIRLLRQAGCCIAGFFGGITTTAGNRPEITRGQRIRDFTSNDLYMFVKFH